MALTTVEEPQVSPERRLREMQNAVTAAKQINYDLRKQLGDADRQNSQLKSDLEVLQLKLDAEKNDNAKLAESNKALEQEVKRVRQEMARSSALKNLNDSSKVGALEVQLEGRKVAYAQLAAEMEKMEEEAQKEREQLTTQLMMLQDENMGLKESNKSSAAHQRVLEENLKSLQTRFASFLDRALMAKEDKLSTEIRAYERSVQMEKERKKIRRESVNLHAQVCLSVCAALLSTWSADDIHLSRPRPPLLPPPVRAGGDDAGADHVERCRRGAPAAGRVGRVRPKRGADERKQRPQRTCDRPRNRHEKEGGDGGRRHVGSHHGRGSDRAGHCARV